MTPEEVKLIADHVTLNVYRAYMQVRARADPETWREIYPTLVGYGVHIWNWLFEQTDTPFGDQYGELLERVSLGSLGAYEQLFGAWDVEAAHDASFADDVSDAAGEMEYLWEVYRKNCDRLQATTMIYAVHESDHFDEAHGSAFALAGGLVTEAMFEDMAKTQIAGRG